MRRLAGLLAALIALSACPAPEPPPATGPVADPWTVMPSSELAVRRGYATRRAIVHSHSPFSHDACDGEGLVNGVPDADCFAQLREALCATRQDALFLTDHDDFFAEREFPEVLLYVDGDQLIQRGELPVANRLSCPDGHQALVMAGTESGMMPIGLEHHVGSNVAARRQAYNDISVAGTRALQAAGGLVLLQHTESWSRDAVLNLPIDGIEIYNLHQNMMDHMGDVVTLVLELAGYPDDMPPPELGLVAVFQENPADLAHWAAASAQRRLPGLLATDAHRNVFNDETSDGERLDSFRRMMHWFSNHLRVDASAELDDRLLKQAIAEGRSYGVFEVLGYPLGFDFHAELAGQSYEMGAATPAGATLHLDAPTLYRQDPEGPAPTLRCRLLRAEGESWTEVAAGPGDLELSVASGVYRAEVRMVPHHLTPWLGRDPERFLAERVWIYSNPIYVGRDG